MTRLTISAAALMAITTPVFAGPVEVPPPPPPVYVEPERCPLAFDCFYLGLEVGYGHGTGNQLGGTQTAPLNIDLDYDGAVYGAFAGYNFQNGAMVYGGEVRFLHGNIADDTTGFEVNSLIDLRGRIGYAPSDSFMVYGALGYTLAQATAASDFDMDGFNAGIGAEFNVSESFFIGADLTARQLEGTLGGTEYDADVHTATIRAGFRF
ncbi:outer membrane beta-barrel protein [Rhodobacterales bacterium HKCCE4037]|nr:outer membrane beta-barrel protein [Rhodobacterales bacterium HKCCE4037]